MSLKRFFKLLICCLTIAYAFFSLLLPHWMQFASSITLDMDIRTTNKALIQIYYLEQEYSDYAEERSIKEQINSDLVYQNIKIKLPVNHLEGLRIDFDNNGNKHYGIKNIKVTNWFEEKEITDWTFQGLASQLKFDKLSDGSYWVWPKDNDPYVGSYFEFGLTQKQKTILIGQLVILSLLSGAIGTLILFRSKSKIINLYSFLKTYKLLIWRMAVNDFKKKYVGSYFGITWAFVQPILTILIFWFVFQIGFRTAPVSQAPFVLWLMCGLIPWFFFADAWSSTTYVLEEYNYLVKKVVFQILILPPVKVLSCLFVHIVFDIFLLAVAFLYGYEPTIYTIQILYYSACAIILAVGLGYFSSAIIVFFKDIGQIVAILLQFGMWLTPIMWSYSGLSPLLQFIIKLNPMFYVVEGFRDAVINQVWFFDHMETTFMFWLITLTWLGVGLYTFKKLKPHFADVL